MDLTKYRALFLEEAEEHLAEMSRALLDLEKNPTAADAIETVFRMAHSIKSMAASLDYAAITEVSHRLEDRMETVRSRGALDGAEEMALLFQGLSGLERLVEVVRKTGEGPPQDPELLAALGARRSGDAGPKKKLPNLS